MIEARRQLCLWGQEKAIFRVIGLIPFFLFAGCARVPWFTTPPQNGQTLARGLLVIDGDFDARDHGRLLDDLDQLRNNVMRTLKLPPSDRTVFVHVFSTAGELNVFIRSRYPSLPERRAYFIKDHQQLSVFACNGPHMAEDLRHEVVHGTLHSVLPDIPLWLDEGLAEYFEVAGPQPGLSAAHLYLLTSELKTGRWRPNLARLERLTTIDQMTQLDYAESWAWVHFLLHGKSGSRALLTGHMNALRVGGPVEPLSVQLARCVYRPDEAIADYLLSH